MEVCKGQHGSDSDAYPVTVTVTVCVSHGDINSYPYSHSIPVPDTNSGIALSDAIRDAVYAQQEKGVRSRP